MSDILLNCEVAIIVDVIVLMWYIYVSVMNNDVIDVFVVLARSKDRALVKTVALVLKTEVLKLGLAM